MNKLEGMICLTGGCLRRAILKLEHESESTSGVVKTKIDEPIPEFLIHFVWGRSHESSVLVSSQVVLILLVQGPSLENYIPFMNLEHLSLAAPYHHLIVMQYHQICLK